VACILIIDGEKLARDSISRILEAEGHRCAAASSVRPALDLIAEGEVELVIIEIMLPELDGFEAIRVIRSHHRELPVIAMAHQVHGTGLQVLRWAERLGANRTLTKPLHPTVLCQVVREALAAARSRRERDTPPPADL
jgi:CheY-like chemotaxis protein